MEIFHNNTLKFFNVTMTDMKDLHFFMSIQGWVILPIAVPLVCLAIHGLLPLIKTSNGVVPVYVINLLISDVLQMCGRPAFLLLSPSGVIYELIAFVYWCGMFASVFFMVCIAGERYVMIVHPVWYRIHRTIKKSLLCSLTVWVVTFVTVGAIVSASATNVIGVDKVFICWSAVCLLPYPIVMFFFVETWKALSKSISISLHERRRILGMLALVLIIYTALFLPYIALTLLMSTCPWVFTDYSFQRIAVMSVALLSLNLLLDPVLYVFMGPRRSLCPPCCRCVRRSYREEPESSVFTPPLVITMTSSGEMPE